MSSVVKAFNDHFMEMVEDIAGVFPDDMDIAKKLLDCFTKMNPKILIRSWNKYVVSKYHKEIAAGQLSYFLDKDYTEDLASSSEAKRIMTAIDRLRSPIKSMSPDVNQEKILKYLQNLSKLTLAFSQTDR